MSVYNDYTRLSIQTADPRAVIVLLYEGIIRFLNQAQSDVAENRRMEASENVNRALRIIHHLRSGLDFDAGGDIAENLAKVYSYMRDTLLQANITCDGEKIEETAGLAKNLLHAWQEIATDPKSAQALQARDAYESEPPEQKPAETAHDASAAPAAPDADLGSPARRRANDVYSNQESEPKRLTTPPPPQAPRAPGDTAAGHQAYGIH